MAGSYPLAGFLFKTKEAREAFVHDLIFSANHAFTPPPNLQALINHIVLTYTDVPEKLLKDGYIGPEYKVWGKPPTTQLFLVSKHHQTFVQEKDFTFQHHHVEPRKTYESVTLPPYPSIQLPYPSFLTNKFIQTEDELMFIHHPSPIPSLLNVKDKQPNHQRAQIDQASPWKPVSVNDLQKAPELLTPHNLTS